MWGLNLKLIAYKKLILDFGNNTLFGKIFFTESPIKGLVE